MGELKHTAELLDRQTLVLERRFSIPPEVLWEAVATREGLSHWFMPTPYELVAGGRFAFQNGWVGDVARLDPPRLVEFVPDAAPDSFLRFEVVAACDGSLFRLIDRITLPLNARETFPRSPRHTVYQPGGPGTHWSGIVAGYHGFVDALEAYLTGSQPAHDYDALCRLYRPVLDAWAAR